MSFATTAGILFVFVSTIRIGPFRTALIMNLEPLTAMVLSALALGEVITPLQAVGSGHHARRAGARFKSGDDDAVTARSCLERYARSWAPLVGSINDAARPSVIRNSCTASQTRPT